jgi:ferric-dicitrate binding protein FerR (iron transport regulator)
MQNKQENIDELLLIRIIEDKADDAEKLLFTTWYNQSAENAALFARLKKVWELSSFKLYSTEANWQQVVKKVRTGFNVPDYIELPEVQGAQKTIGLKLLLRTAAAAILVVGLFFLFKNIGFNSEQLIVSGKDLKKDEPYLMADSSLVYLNGNAEISFSKHFGTKDRDLTLKGEAFFEVSKNEKLPFQITSNATTTRVLGTSFNVFSDEKGIVKVSVVTGVVEFFAEKENSAKLQTGEQGTYLPETTVIKKEVINDPNFQSWRTGVLIFEETPLSEAFEILNRHYSKVFFLKGESETKITTVFDNQPVEDVLEELNLLLNTKNKFKNDTILFLSNN